MKKILNKVINLLILVTAGPLWIALQLGIAPIILVWNIILCAVYSVMRMWCVLAGKRCKYEWVILADHYGWETASVPELISILWNLELIK